MPVMFSQVIELQVPGLPAYRSHGVSTSSLVNAGISSSRGNSGSRISAAPRGDEPGSPALTAAASAAAVSRRRALTGRLILVVVASPAGHLRGSPSGTNGLFHSGSLTPISMQQVRRKV